MSFLVSVIIPVYNKELYVTRSIRSVLAQTYPYFELIIVNDGSTDHSLERIRNYDDPRIKIINQDNKGVSGARNKGVLESDKSSDFILFLDADDEWYSDQISTILYLREKYPSAGLYSTAYDIVENKYKEPSNICPVYGNDVLIENYFVYTRKNFHHPVCSSNVGVPKDIFMKFNGFSTYEKYGEDLDLWGRIAIEYPVAFSKNAGACIHFDSINRTSEKIFEDFHLSPFVKSAKNAIKENKVSPDKMNLLKKYISELQLSDAFRCIKLNKMKFARELLYELSFFDVGYKKYLYLFVSYLPYKSIPFGLSSSFHEKIELLRGLLLK